MQRTTSDDPSPTSLRPAAPEDIPAALALWSVAGENAARPADDPALVGALVARDPEALILAESEGEIVGTVIAGWDGWRAHLYRLAVSPAVRGNGVGRLLVDAAEDRLRRLGAIRFDAMVLDANHGGGAAWAAMGYGPQDDWTRWVRPASD